mgnify:CR=1 FL=1
MKKLKVFLAVGLLCCGLSMSMAEAKTMTLDKTKSISSSRF